MITAIVDQEVTGEARRWSIQKNTVTFVAGTISWQRSVRMVETRTKSRELFARFGAEARRVEDWKLLWQQVPKYLFGDSWRKEREIMK